MAHIRRSVFNATRVFGHLACAGPLVNKTHSTNMEWLLISSGLAVILTVKNGRYPLPHSIPLVAVFNFFAAKSINEQNRKSP